MSVSENEPWRKHYKSILCKCSVHQPTYFVIWRQGSRTSNSPYEDAWWGFTALQNTHLKLSPWQIYFLQETLHHHPVRLLGMFPKHVSNSCRTGNVKSTSAFQPEQRACWTKVEGSDRQELPRWSNRNSEIVKKWTTTTKRSHSKGENHNRSAQ